MLDCCYYCHIFVATITHGSLCPCRLMSAAVGYGNPQATISFMLQRLRALTNALFESPVAAALMLPRHSCACGAVLWIDRAASHHPSWQQCSMAPGCLPVLAWTSMASPLARNATSTTVDTSNISQCASSLEVRIGGPSSDTSAVSICP